MNFIFRNRKKSQNHGSGNICAKATKQVAFRNKTNQKAQINQQTNKKKKNQTKINQTKSQPKKKKTHRSKRKIPKGDSFEILFLESLTHVFWMFWSVNIICCSIIASGCKYPVGSKAKKANLFNLSFKPVCDLHCPTAKNRVGKVIALKLLPGDSVGREIAYCHFLWQTLKSVQSSNIQENIINIYIVYIHTHTFLYIYVYICNVYMHTNTNSSIRRLCV